MDEELNTSVKLEGLGVLDRGAGAANGLDAMLSGDIFRVTSVCAVASAGILAGPKSCVNAPLLGGTAGGKSDLGAVCLVGSAGANAPPPNSFVNAPDPIDGAAGTFKGREAELSKGLLSLGSGSASLPKARVNAPDCGGAGASWSSRKKSSESELSRLRSSVGKGPSRTRIIRIYRGIRRRSVAYSGSP